MKKPWYQQTYSHVATFVAGALLLGSAFDAILNARALIPAGVTYVATAGLFVTIVLSELWIRRRGLVWIVPGGQAIRLKNAPKNWKGLALGMVALLWIPRLVPQPQSRTLLEIRVGPYDLSARRKALTLVSVPTRGGSPVVASIPLLLINKSDRTIERLTIRYRYPDEYQRVFLPNPHLEGIQGELVLGRVNGEDEARYEIHGFDPGERLVLTDPILMRASDVLNAPSQLTEMVRGDRGRSFLMIVEGTDIRQRVIRVTIAALGADSPSALISAFDLVAATPLRHAQLDTAVVIWSGELVEVPLRFTGPQASNLALTSVHPSGMKVALGAF